MEKETETEIAYKEMIGHRIYELRHAKGLSQEALAERANLSRTHLSNIENGNTHYSINTLIDIAQALDEPLALLLMEPDKMHYQNELSVIFNSCSRWEAVFLLRLTWQARKLLMLPAMDEKVDESGLFYADALF